jgi:hypothetical protein
MNPQSNDAFRRLVGEFSNTGALLESHGEQADTIAEAMVEVGLRTLIKIAGVNAVAKELRNIARHIERNAGKQPATRGLAKAPQHTGKDRCA